MKSSSRLAVIGILAAGICAMTAGTARAWSIQVSGSVRQPLTITGDELSNMQTVRVRLNEMTLKKEYGGSFVYRGVPLKSVLELAAIEKEETDFPKQVDMAVIVRGADGSRAVLSWGEVMYRNAGDIVLALSAEPIMPMKKCSDCHKSAADYRKWWDPLHKKVALPRLVVTGDFFTERSIEGVTSIEIVDPRPKTPVRKMGGAQSPSFTIVNGKDTRGPVSDLASFARIEVSAKQVGDGKGFHGLREFEGASLAAVLKKLGINPGLDSVIIASAPDGYRSLISAGELLLSPSGGNIIVADSLGGKPIDKLGKFVIAVPDDLSADRWVRAVEKIEIVSFPEKASLSIIGVGCGDTSLITLEAISAMAKADAFVCTGDIAARFAKYMGGRPVLHDPLLNMAHYYRKMNPGVNEAEAKKKVEELRAANIRTIKETLASGKSVALLEYGDPTIYGSWTYWLLEHFKREDVRIVPGVSAFNAANAMIGRNVAARGSVVITVPDGIRTNEGMLAAVAKNGDTIAIFVGLAELPKLMPLLRKHYPGSTPVAVAYKAGYAGSGKLVRTDIDRAQEVVEKEGERFLGVIYIGPDVR
ncbi:MAG: SAM-dependent methyltransferase [Spirochaetota bacterium]